MNLQSKQVKAFTLLAFIICITVFVYYRSDVAKKEEKRKQNLVVNLMVENSIASSFQTYIDTPRAGLTKSQLVMVDSIRVANRMSKLLDSLKQMERKHSMMVVQNPALVYTDKLVYKRFIPKSKRFNSESKNESISRLSIEQKFFMANSSKALKTGVLVVFLALIVLFVSYRSGFINFSKSKELLAENNLMALNSTSNDEIKIDTPKQGEITIVDDFRIMNTKENESLIRDSLFLKAYYLKLVDSIRNLKKGKSIMMGGSKSGFVFRPERWKEDSATQKQMLQYMVRNYWWREKLSFQKDSLNKKQTQQ